MGNLTARGLATAALAAMASLGCPSESGSGAADDAGAASDDRAIAERLLTLGAALPLRSEVVAITDRLSIAASKHEDASHAAALKTLAAALRERVWRFDRRDTDAREALELYQQVVEALPATAVACASDLARARIASELSRDASAAYRELYLALERQASSDVEDDGHEACVAKLRAMLERAEAFRPTGSAWQALQREAAQAVPVASASAAPSSSGSASSLPPPGEGEIVVAPPDAMVTPGKKRLTKVHSYGGSQSGGRVVLYLDKPAQYDTGELDPDPAAGRPHRVYIDLKDVRYKGLDDDVKVDGLIKGVRLGKRNFGTRVVLDLAEDAARRVFYLPEPYRVVIDVSTRKATPEAAAPTGKRAVRRVALDPGHGGWDAGAVGPTGLREKDVALDVAHRAAPALASELGIETILTRDTDVFIELDERTARANAFQSDLFISIHCNATENGQASGLEVYILDPTREQDAAAMRAVARENHGRGHALDPALLDAQLINIAAGLGMARSTEGSRVFADLLRKATLGSVTQRFPQTTDHGTKTAGFFVLVGAEMPAVLYETAFISNPDDESRLGTADYRQKLADAIVNGVRAYRDGLR